MGDAFLPPIQLHNHMANVQVMCLHFLFKNVFVILVLNRDFLLLCPRIRGWNDIHKKYISLLCCLYKCSCFHEWKLEMFGSLVTPNISFMLEFLHVLNRLCYVFTSKIMFRVQCACWRSFVFWCSFIYWFKMKILCFPIHLRIMQNESW